MTPAQCSTCGANIANAAMTGILCDTCHAGATAPRGNIHLQGAVAIGMAAGFAPFFAHFSLNGVDYLAVGAGLLAIVFGAVGMVSVARRPERASMMWMAPGAAILLGLFDVLKSGVLFAFFT